MRLINLLTKEEMLKMDCNYIFYKPENKKEQGCRAMRIDPKLPLNKILLQRKIKKIIKIKNNKKEDER